MFQYIFENGCDVVSRSTYVENLLKCCCSFPPPDFYSSRPRSVRRQKYNTEVASWVWHEKFTQTLRPVAHPPP